MIVTLLLLLSGKGYAQPEEKIKVILASSDIKKIEKADQYIDDADRLIESANQLYLETFAVQGDVELDEKARGKKVKQLEGQARQKIIEASTLYQKGSEIKYGLYKTYIERFWSGYKGNEADLVKSRLLEEQSNDFYYQALTLRNEAAKMPDGNEKVEKFSKANALEKQAIDRQITVLGQYYNIDISETPEEEVLATEDLDEPAQAETVAPAAITQPEGEVLPVVDTQAQPVPAEETYQPVIAEPPQPTPTEVPYQTEVSDQPEAMQPETPDYSIGEPRHDTIFSGQVIISRPMIELYNRYVASQGRPEDSVSTSGFANLSSFDRDQILQTWYAYLDRPIPEVPAQEKPVLAETEKDVVPDATGPEKITEPVREEQLIAVIENERQAQQVPGDADVIYRVQIAANKTELSQRALQNIYMGNKSVEMLEEDGWYKYSVGDFSTYADANKFRKSCNVKNAFIVAYRKGQPFLPGLTEGPETVMAPATAIGKGNMPAGLVFRIQVAAARNQLTREQLARIYTGHYAVEVIEEEGWYKYQLIGVRLFSDALAILKDIPVKHAFISAYEDGNKTDLYQAVVKNRNLEKTIKSAGRRNLQEVEYHVQLAASRLPIAEEDFSQLYAGPDPIALIIEDGWYKYRIKAGNSYAQAKEIKARCGVNKAFVIPYQRARRISLYEVLRNHNP